jgi:hypothetical protein
MWTCAALNIINIAICFFFVHEFPPVLLMDSMHYSTVIIANVNSKSLRKPVKNGVDFDEIHCTITQEAMRSKGVWYHDVEKTKENSWLFI